MISHKYSRSKDGCTNGLDHKLAFHFFITHHIMLDHACIFEVPLGFDLIEVAAARSAHIRSVVLRQVDSIGLDILVGLVHPATCTLEILLVAVHQLLD